jgi:hypothetical protein
MLRNIAICDGTFEAFDKRRLCRRSAFHDFGFDRFGLCAAGGHGRHTETALWIHATVRLIQQRALRWRWTLAS